MRLRTR